MILFISDAWYHGNPPLLTFKEKFISTSSLLSFHIDLDFALEMWVGV